jgi:hypothetical protein
MGYLYWAKNCQSLARNVLAALSRKHISQPKLTQTLPLSVVFYGCESWFFVQKEKRTLRVFEDKATRDCFKLHNESSPNSARVVTFRKMRGAAK